VLRDLFLLAVLSCCTCSACAPATVPRVTPGELQAEHERLAAKTQEYYRAQRGRVARISRQLLAQVPNPPHLQFLVAEGEAKVNAGATFGKVVITWGLLQFVRTDDELAAVLSHEIGHHTQGHITKAIAESVAVTSLAIAAGMVVPGGTEVVDLLGRSIVNHFYQQQELEADAVGLRYAAAAGYNPEARAALFERMAVEIPQTLTAAYFASHPSSPERTVAARKVAVSLVESGVYAPPPQPSVSSTASEAEVGTVPTPQPSTTVPSATAQRARANANNDSLVETQLRSLYRELRASRLTQEEYESKKEILLKGH
jgi:predicted Zn-dependent protease